jgi:di/tricarboxylate transporter
VLVYALIIGRRRLGIPIWAAMLAGAALMIGLQVTGAVDAFRAVNLEVIAFLFGMFSLVSALERAGVLKAIATRMLARAKTPSQVLMIFVVGMGVVAAFLVNDTIALLGIPPCRPGRQAFGHQARCPASGTCLRHYGRERHDAHREPPEPPDSHRQRHLVPLCYVPVLSGRAHRREPACDLLYPQSIL